MDHFQSFDQNNIPINNPTPSNNVEADIVQKSNATSRRAWSQKEDNLLKQAIKIHGTNWIQVASSLQNRNPSQCAQRWKRIKPYNYNMRKPWTAKEDQLLLKLVQSHKKNWVQIAKCIPNRTSKQVRERFVNKLNPEINKDPFSTEEDLIIVEGFKSFGSKWCKISKLLKGRPENIIKNRFYSFIRKHYFNIENPYYVIPQHQPDQQLLLLRDSEVKQTKKNLKIIQKERRKKIRSENQFENQDIQNNEKEENNNQQSSLQKKTKPLKSDRNIMKKRKLQESKVEEKRNVEDEILENQQEILEREQVKEEKSISQDQVKEEVESENQSQNEHLKEENQQKLSQFAPFPVIYNGVQPFKIMYFYPSTMNVQLLSHYYMNTPYLQYGVQSQETLLSRSQDIQYQKKNTQ